MFISEYYAQKIDKCIKPMSYSSSMYRIVEHCPDITENTTLDELCQNPAILADMAIVSGKVSGTVYGNKHCAECNGETDVAVWSMTIHYCPSFKYIMFRSFEERDNYVGNNCCLDAIQPDSFVLLTRQKMECYEDMPQQSRVCNLTGLWDSYDEQIEIACQNSSDLNHTISVVQTISKLLYVFPSIYCYLCNVPNGQTSSGVCSIDDVSTVADSGIHPKSILNVKLNQRPGNSTSSKCQSFEIIDPYTVSNRIALKH